MPLPEKGNSMQMCLFLRDWKWEINFLMGDFSQLSLSPQFLHSRKLEVTAIVLCWETQPFVIALIAITWVQNIISSLDYCNSFLNDPSASGPGPVESLLSTASRMILLVPANTLNPPLASQLIRVNTNKAPHNLSLSVPLISSLGTVHLPHCTPATQTSLLFVKHPGNIPTYHLRMCYPLYPTMIAPLISSWLALQHPPGFYLKLPSLSILTKILIPSQHVMASSFTYFFSLSCH